MSSYNRLMFVVSQTHDDYDGKPSSAGLIFSTIAYKAHKLLEKISLHGYHAMAALKQSRREEITAIKDSVSMAITPWPH